VNRGGIIVVALALTLVSLIVVQWLIQPDPSRRNYEFFPNMVESVARDAQNPPLVLDDGTIVDRRIPPGSVARGYLPLPFPATPEGALLAGQTLTNPIAADDLEAVARGALVFNTFCAVCHGPAGLGDGPVTKRGVPPPPSFLLDNAVNMADGQMYHVITLGQKNMSSYASQVTRDDRWKVIRFVRTLQESPEATAAPATNAEAEAQP
jgi:mono/diheme cytochrome c family protein